MNLDWGTIETGEILYSTFVETLCDSVCRVFKCVCVCFLANKCCLFKGKRRLVEVAMITSETIDLCAMKILVNDKCDIDD